jgi:hypothetical protein
MPLVVRGECHSSGSWSGIGLCCLVPQTSRQSFLSGARELHALKSPGRLFRKRAFSSVRRGGSVGDAGDSDMKSVFFSRPCEFFTPPATEFQT